MEEKKSICEHCGCNIGILQINPFDWDVHEKENWEFICDECFQDLICEI